MLLCSATTPTQTKLPLELRAACLASARSGLEHGFHNVSRWMTWLPISLKNAAKCDKWYQLQNHSITESLNANGAREKPSTAIPVHAVSLSVEQKPISQKESWLVGNLLAGGRVVTPSQPSNRRFMSNSTFNIDSPRWSVKLRFGGLNLRRFNGCNNSTSLKNKKTSFCYRPECGRITRRT